MAMRYKIIIVAAVVLLAAAAASIYYFTGFGKQYQARSLQKQAEALYHQARFNDAEMTLRRAIELTPSDPELHSLMGRILERIGDQLAAYQSYRQAAWLKPDDPHFNVQAARAAVALGKLRDARDFYQKALARKPLDITILYQLGYVYTLDRKLDSAQKIYQKIIDEYPRETGAWLNLAVVYTELNEMEKSRDALNHAEQLDAASPEVYNQLGNLLIIERQYEQAEAMFEKASLMDPANDDYRDNLRYVRKILIKLTIEKADANDQPAPEAQPGSTIAPPISGSTAAP